jgi:hypothetical protein
VHRPCATTVPPLCHHWQALWRHALVRIDASADRTMAELAKDVAKQMARSIAHVTRRT